jgi:hypothetical protein
MSAIPLKADIAERYSHVSFGPEADIPQNEKAPVLRRPLASVIEYIRKNATLARQRELDSVRRTGHQQFGRVERMRGDGCYSVLVRQHKDDFIVRLHDVVIIVLCFRDYDGARQIKARLVDPGSGCLHGAMRREVRMGIPVQ